MYQSNGAVKSYVVELLETEHQEQKHGDSPSVHQATPNTEHRQIRSRMGTLQSVPWCVRLTQFSDHPS